MYVYMYVCMYVCIYIYIYTGYLSLVILASMENRAWVACFVPRPGHATYNLLVVEPEPCEHMSLSAGTMKFSRYGKRHPNHQPCVYMYIYVFIYIYISIYVYMYIYIYI